MVKDKSETVQPRMKPWYRSVKKAIGTAFLANGLGMGWFTFFRENPNDVIALISLILGTGITLLGIKMAGGLIAHRNDQ